MAVTSKLVVEFTKMTGAGNDFIVIDNRFYRFDQRALSRLTRITCPRRTGVGADGLLAVRSDESPNSVHMIYFNADGSEAPMCGNGARCVARFALDAGIVSERSFTIATGAGAFRAAVPEAGNVSFYFDGLSVAPRKLVEGSSDSDAFYVWTSTDHVVVFVQNVNEVDVEVRGRSMRYDPQFAPRGTNVNYAEVLDGGDSVIRMRTYERGVEGETLACGTGAMASAITARLTNRVARDDVRVEMPGGEVSVRFRRTADGVDNVCLEGPAAYVFRGTVEVEPSKLFDQHR